MLAAVPSTNFSMTPAKVCSIITYFASLERGSMHFIMPKNRKVKQQEYDLGMLNANQEIKHGPKLLSKVLDACEDRIYSTARLLHEALTLDPTTDPGSLVDAKKHLGLSAASITAYDQIEGNSFAALLEEMVDNLLVIHTTVITPTTDPAMMTHDEIQARKVKAKTDKADKGRAVIIKSSEGGHKRRIVEVHSFYNISCVCYIELVDVFNLI
jgi:hypothetical protein